MDDFLKKLSEKYEDKDVFQSPETVNTDQFHNNIESIVKHIHKGNLCIN